jgi:hypothetical protein
MTERNQFPSVAMLQAAVVELHDRLDKPEVLGTLPNGEPQLSIDASPAEMNRASVAQLRDLSKRRGEGQSRPLGGFGSSF